jgi:hypothetical protein
MLFFCSVIGTNLKQTCLKQHHLAMTSIFLYASQ